MGKEAGGKYLTPPETKSPDGRYAVQVPVFSPDDKDPDPRRNRIIELSSGKTVAVIAGDFPAYDRTLNHHGMGEASWSQDGSLLLWKVDGKWSPDTLAVVKLEKGAAKWQLDLLTAAQQALLKRTRKAAPDRYAAKKKENTGDGSAYPDGFTVDVTTSAGKDEPLTLPLTVHVDLTSNPKEDLKTNLDSQLEGIVNKDGVFVVQSFHLGHKP